ncbi:MAG: Flp family type IVb pilin [Bacillota bacterium]|jgi:pilus assembly protein Flp/PilA|nr:Flp family type IVb pilin [Clostridia bacterium]
MMNLVKRLWNEEDGQGMTEYGLIIALVSVALIITVVAFKDRLVQIFQAITDNNDLKNVLEGES